MATQLDIAVPYHLREVIFAGEGGVTKLAEHFPTPKLGPGTDAQLSRGALQCLQLTQEVRRR